jgi:hypothetical protein
MHALTLSLLAAVHPALLTFMREHMLALDGAHECYRTHYCGCVYACVFYMWRYPQDQAQRGPHPRTFNRPTTGHVTSSCVQLK